MIFFCSSLQQKNYTYPAPNTITVIFAGKECSFFDRNLVNRQEIPIFAAITIKLQA